MVGCDLGGRNDDAAAREDHHEHRRVGAGMIGGTVGGLWAKAGHRIRFATRHPEYLGRLSPRRGRTPRRARRRRLRRFGEILFCSVPYGAWPALAPVIAPLVSGKVVLDSANP